MAQQLQQMQAVTGSGPGIGARRGHRNADGDVAARAAALLAQALCSEDAELGGMRADDVLADPPVTIRLLAGPEAWPTARFAVVQRFGRVGALIVVGYEMRHIAAGLRRVERTDVAALLDALIDGFDGATTDELEEILAVVDRASGEPDGDLAAAYRRLHATYAVAARDGTHAAHRAYMEALDQVHRTAGSALAS